MIILSFRKLSSLRRNEIISPKTSWLFCSYLFENKEGDDEKEGIVREWYYRHRQRFNNNRNSSNRSSIRSTIRTIRWVKWNRDHSEWCMILIMTIRIKAKDVYMNHLFLKKIIIIVSTSQCKLNHKNVKKSRRDDNDTDNNYKDSHAG